MKVLIAWMLAIAIIGYGTAAIIRSTTDNRTTDMMRSRTRRIEEQIGLEAGRE